MTGRNATTAKNGKHEQHPCEIATSMTTRRKRNQRNTHPRELESTNQTRRRITAAITR